MNKNESQKFSNNNNQNILDEEFFDSFAPSKKITVKKKKINELITNLKQNKEYLSSLLSINNRQKLSKLYELILLNLTENNNTFVLNQLELIEILGQYLYDQNEFKSFYKQALPKLFDKFYLQNQKINETIIQMFNNSILNRILNIEDYYPHIENISLEEDDDYKVIVLNFFYNQLVNNDNIIYEKLPKNIINTVKNLTHESNPEIAEIASKIINIFEKYINNNDNNNKEESIDNIKNNNDENDNNNYNIRKFNINSNDEDEGENYNRNYDNNNNGNDNYNNRNNNNNNISDDENNNYNNRNSNNCNSNDEIDNKNDNYISRNYNNNNKNNDNYNNINDISNSSIHENINYDDFINNENNINGKNNNDSEEIKYNIKEKPDNYKNKNNDYNDYNNYNYNEKNEDLKSENEYVKENSNNKLNEKIDKNSDDEEIIDNEIKKGESNFMKNDSSKPKPNNTKKKNNYKSRINRSRKLGIITKNNKENEERKNTDINNNIDNNKQDKNRTSIKNEKNFYDSPENFEKDNNNYENKKYINDFDELPVKGINNNNDNKQIIKSELEPKKNVINIDDLPIKGIINYENNKDKSMPTKEQQEIKNKNIINIDDLPIKGVSNYDYKENNNNGNKEEKVSKKNNEVINIDELPIKGMITNNNQPVIDNENDELNNINNKGNMVIDIDKNIFSESPSKNKKAKINKKFSNNSNNKKDKFENFEVKVKEPPYNQEKILNDVNNDTYDNFNNCNKEEVKEKQEKDKEKEKNEEMKFQSIKLILGEEIVDYISSNKWEEKKQGYELIINLINKDIIEPNYINDLYQYIRYKLKDFKETNFNINKEALNIFITIAKKDIMPKKLLMPLIMAYSEKIADIKLKDTIIELININNKINGPESIIQELIKKLKKKSNPKMLIEYSNLFSNILKDSANIANNMPYKELIDYSIFMANNNNPQVRTASINLICTLYKIYGASIRSAIKGIKESTLKLIEAELDKIEISPEQNGNLNDKLNTKEQNNINDENAKNNQENNNTVNSNIPQDISKKITKELLKDIDEGKWNDKKDAVEKIEKIINDANMKLLPNGLNDLFDIIKHKLSDCNKNLVKILISLLTKLIESLSQGFKIYSKNIALSLIPNLADKSLIIRNECLKCFDKWVECTGLETLVIYFPQFLKNDNVESRLEIMKFIEKYNNKFTKTLGENVYKELVDPLLLCLQDRTNSVRNKAEDLIKLSFNYVPIEIYYKKIKDFKPAIADNLSQMMNKIESNYNLEENKNNENINDKKNTTDNNDKNNVKKKNNEKNVLKKKENTDALLKNNGKDKKDFKNTLKDRKDISTNKSKMIKDNDKDNINEKNDKKINKDIKKIKNQKPKNVVENKNISQDESEESEDDNNEKNKIYKKGKNKGKETSEDESENESDNQNEESDNESESENEYENKGNEKNNNNKKDKMKEESKTFNSEGNSDSNSDNNSDMDEKENSNDNENKENNKNQKNIKKNNIFNKDKDKKYNKNLKSHNTNEGNIKVNKIKNNNKKEKNLPKQNNKKKLNANHSNIIDKVPSEILNEDFNTNLVKPKYNKVSKSKNVFSWNTRNNKNKEIMNTRNDDDKNEVLNNKPISKYNSDKRRVLSKSSAKKKLPSGKSKPLFDTMSKKKILFSNDNNDNDLDNNNNNQRILSNSVGLRNNKKGMKNNKSNERKIIKKKPLAKYSKIFLMSNRLTLNKKKRYELDKKYNFNLNTLTKDDYNNIKEISEQLFTEGFLKKMLNTDFSKQIEALMDMKNNLDKNENIQTYLNNFDIILKLISIKIYNNFNPSLTKALCEFLDSLFNVVNGYEYFMTDIEINMILALLIEKYHINNIEIKRQINYLMKLYISLFDINKIIMQILNMTLLSNNKIKANILEFILDLNENQNLDICNKSLIRVFALFLHCNDNDVKIRLFELFRNIYNTIGDKLWTFNDVIAPKEMNYLKNNIFKNEEINIEPVNNNIEDQYSNEDEEDNNNENYNDEIDDINNNNDEDYIKGKLNEYKEEIENKRIYPQQLNKNNNPKNITNTSNKINIFNKDNINNNINSNKNKFTNNNINSNKNNNFNSKKNSLTNKNINTNNNNIIKNSNNNNNYRKYKKRDINYYDNKFEKYFKNKKSDDNKKYGNNNDNKENNDNNDYNGDEKINFNNIDNDSNTMLHFNDNSYNTFDTNHFDTLNSYSIPDKMDSNNKNIPEFSKNNFDLKNTNTDINTTKASNKIVKNTPRAKKVYDNSLKNYNKNVLHLPEKKSSIKSNLSIERKGNTLKNEMLSHSSSSDNIKSEKELLSIMNNLSSEDESEKLNTIIIVHEILCTKYQDNKYILIPIIDNIILIFINIMHQLFDVDNIENINVKFAKYLVTILCKIASNKELITHISYKVLHDLIHELLKYLLISNLDKIGENQEGNIIFKSLNSAMLRILENCDTTSVILVLLEIIKENQTKEDDYNLSNLAIKCLIKITQNLKDYIYNIEFDKILLQIHLILINYDKYINNIEIKNQTDVMTVKFIKNFIIDVVKIKKNDVLIDYNNSVKDHKIKDNHIFHWIKNTLLMIKNIETNKQIISDNISKSSNNKTNEDFDNDNEDDNGNDNGNDNENNNENNTGNDNDDYDDKNKYNKFEKRLSVERKDEKQNLLNNVNNIKNRNIISKINNRSNNINDTKKEEFKSIVERIKLLKQTLKNNNNIYYANNNINIRRKSSVTKKIKNKK